MRLVWQLKKNRPAERESFLPDGSFAPQQLRIQSPCLSSNVKRKLNEEFCEKGLQFLEKQFTI